MISGILLLKLRAKFLWKKWIPGFQELFYTKEQLYGNLTDEEIVHKIEEISALSIVSSDDPSIFMSYRMKPDAAIPSDPKKVRGWQIHHVIFGIKLKNWVLKLI
jgi:hypothetical protein